MVRRIFVEKRPGFDVEAGHILSDLKDSLGLKNIETLRVVNRYDVEGLSEEEYRAARTTIFSEPNTDMVYDETLPEAPGARVFAMEYLPGQYDQRADSAAQCVQLLTQGASPSETKVLILMGDISDTEFDKVKSYLINPVEARLAGLEKPDSLDINLNIPEKIARVGASLPGATSGETCKSWACDDPPGALYFQD